MTFGSAHPIALDFIGAAPEARIEAGDAAPGRANYLVGENEKEWKTNLPVYSSIRYRDLWPGIDVVYHVDHDRLKADFLVASGASPTQIRWRYRDGARVAIDEKGNLQVASGEARLQENAPELFQGTKRVPGTFRADPSGTVSFAVGGFDPQQPLLIDPLIAFGTYFGGSGTSSSTSITYAPNGNAIIAGWTSSLIPAGTQMGALGSVDAFVASFSAAGVLQFCTYIGGSGDDRIMGIASDPSSNLLITGFTTSRNFPVKNAIQAVSGGGRDAFVAKLDATGSNLVFSTYLGGSDVDQANGITVDTAGNIYLAGDTRSLNFPVLNALQRTKSGGQDAFVTKLSSAGQLIYSTYVGGGADDHAAGIAVDATGEPSVAGSTFSHDFPVAQAYQAHSGGGEDAILFKLNAAGSGLMFSTYFGGNGGSLGADERANAVVVDSTGNTFIAGQSSSANFPVTTGAFQTTSNGGLDAFAAKFDVSGNLVYSTLLSGSSIDVANAIAVGVAGNAVVAGYTASPDFPVARPVQLANHGTYNAFVTSINPAGQRLAYSTYLGGTALDQATGLVLDRSGSVLLTGSTSSADFPVVNPAQQWLNGTQNAFFTKIVMGWKPGCFLDNGLWIVDRDRDHSFAQYFVFGQTGDIPVVGDWTGTGQYRIGVFRNGTWLLDANGNGTWDGVAGGDLQISFGQAGDIPVVGDWTGSGKQSLGIYRGSTWILDLSGHLSGQPTGVADRVLSYGCASCTPVVGDWKGTGKTKIGMIDRGLWWLEDNGDDAWTTGDAPFWFGNPTDQALSGDWDGSGVDRPGIFRTGAWVLDTNGNRVFEAGQGDLLFYFGPAACKAVMLK